MKKDEQMKEENIDVPAVSCGVKYEFFSVCHAQLLLRVSRRQLPLGAAVRGRRM